MNKTHEFQDLHTSIRKCEAAQNEIVQAFFKKDGVGEIVESMHCMVESVLFSGDLERVTPEMRVHIVNQLRVASLITKLGEVAIK